MNNLFARAKRPKLGHTVLATYTCEFGSRGVVIGGLSGEHADELKTLLRENPRVVSVHVHAPSVEKVAKRQARRMRHLAAVA